jgi:uncharacterized protein (TIGR02996 family)
MTHADAFLQDILAHPDDDAPRLIFADWLEEQGDRNSAVRAEFIRVQCTLSKEHLPDTKRAELEVRQQELLDQHGDTWAQPLRRVARAWAFHRGFIDDVSVRADRLLSAAGRRMFRHYPIQHLRLLRGTEITGQPYNVPALADCEHLRRLCSLDLRGNRLESRDVRAWVVSPHLTSLTALNLSHNWFGDSGLRALADAPLLAGLTHLDIRHNDFGAAGARALIEALERLARGPEGLRLRTLDVRDNRLSTAGRRVLAESPLLQRLLRR